MVLELNLIKLENIYTQAGRILSRKRVTLDEQNSFIEPLVEFINKNIPLISPAISDKDFVSRLENMKSITSEEFNCMRYILAEYGFDILMYTVADLEIDAEGIPEGSIEYNIIDYTDVIRNFIPNCTKIISSEEDLVPSEIYSKIVDIFDLFKGNLFMGRKISLLEDIEAMKSIESVIGHAPPALMQHASSILDFLGKKVFVLTN